MPPIRDEMGHINIARTDMKMEVIAEREKNDVKMRIDHLPFPMPQRPHSFVQQWRHLSLLHWGVDPARLTPYIPDGLELDFFENKAYVSIIPFMMVGVGHG